MRFATRLLVGWDAGVGLYLALAYHLMAECHVAHIRLRARVEDEGRTAILVLTTAAALASLGAIVAELGSSSTDGSARPPAQLILATVMCRGHSRTRSSRCTTRTTSARENGGKGGGLAFHGGEEPDYWDFVYFSFVIGMTSQVSDVAIVSEVDAPDGSRAWNHFLRVQRGVVGADRQHRRERDLARRSEAAHVWERWMTGRTRCASA